MLRLLGRPWAFRRVLGMAGGAAGAAYDADAAALFSAMTTEPSDERKGVINAAILALKAAGVWTQLDALWLMAAHDSQAARLNWINPVTFTLSPVNSPTFIANAGYQAASSGSKYVDTTFIPATHGARFALNTASMGVWQTTGNVASADDFGAQDGTNVNVTDIAISVSGTSFFRISQNDSAGLASIASPVGLAVLQRNSASQIERYQNGSSLGTFAKNASGRSGYSLFIGARNSAGSPVNVSDRQYSMAFVGGVLDSTAQAALYGIVGNYLAALTSVQAYFDVSSVVDYTANVVTGAIVYLVNGSATATVRYRDFEAGTWYGAIETTFDLGTAYSGTSCGIAMISDLHFGYGGADAAACLASAINDMDDVIGDVAHVCVLGDICHDADYYDDYLAVRATSDIAAANWHEQGGNHDYPVLATFVSKLGYSTAYNSFDVGNVTIMMTSPDSGPQTLGATQLTWLSDTIAANSNRILLLCVHQGVASTTRETTRADGHIEPAAAINELASNGVRAIFCGHSHGYAGVGAPDATCIVEV